MVFYLKLQMIQSIKQKFDKGFCSNSDDFSSSRNTTSESTAVSSTHEKISYECI